MYGLFRKPASRAQKELRGPKGGFCDPLAKNSPFHTDESTDDNLVSLG